VIAFGFNNVETDVNVIKANSAANGFSRNNSRHFNGSF
jgi:hypothetical protein